MADGLSADHHKVSKSFGFGMKAMKRFPEVVPLVTILSAVCVGAVAFVGYSLATKPDVNLRFGKSQYEPRYEGIAGDKSTKLKTVFQHEKIEELDKLRKEIGSYKF